MKLHRMPLLRPAGILALLGASLFPLLGLFVPMDLISEISAGVFGVFLISARVLYERRSARKFLKGCAAELSIDRNIQSGVPFQVKVQFHAPWREVQCEVRLPPRDNIVVKNDVVPLEIVPELSQRGESVAFAANIEALPVARGGLDFDSVYGRFFFPLSICAWQCEIPLGEKIEREIVPRASENETFAPFHLLQGGETPREHGIRGSSEFHSLRPYSRGDDRRLVDWKRSSRGRGMFVRTYRPDTHQRISLVLDCGRRMNVRVGERLQIEYATDAIAQLVRLCESHEDETGLLAFHHQILASLPCARHHRGELLRALQTLRPGQLETDYGLFSDWLRQHRRRSLLLFVTSISSPGNLDLLAKVLLPVRRTHVPVVIAVADEQLETFALSTVSNLDEAYVVSAAGAQLEEIERRAKNLTARGIDTIVCKAAELSFTLQTKYLELKNSGRI